MKILLLSMLLMAASVTEAYDFKALADKHILPGYLELKNQTASLHKAGTSFCNQHNNNHLEPLTNAFRSAFLSWQSMQHIRFGPIQYLTRQHRYQMWPDKRSSVSKHLARLLQDPDLHKADFDISGKSVAVQGFSALERLLFTDKPIDASRCKVIVAITGNLQKMSANLLTDWADGDASYASLFGTASEGNDIFESDIDLASQLLNSLHTQLEVIVTQKLDRPLDNTINKARGKRSEAWRSQSSMLAIQNNLIATQKLYKLTFANKLNKALADKIDVQFIKAIMTIDHIQLPLKEAVTETSQREKLMMLRQQVSLLKRLIAKSLANKLNLLLGFNSLDGD